MIDRKQTSKFVSWAALAAGIAALGVGQALLQNKAEAQRNMIQAPVFEVDPLWPKPIAGQLLGMAIGVGADEQDHTRIIHRSSATWHNNETVAERSAPPAECRQ